MGADAVGLFVWLLCNASPKILTYDNTVTLRKGENKTSLSTISRYTKLSIQRVRTLLTKLNRIGVITMQATTKGRWIYICKYGKYQYTSGKQTNKWATKFTGAIEETKETNKETVKNRIGELANKKTFY